MPTGLLRNLPYPVLDGRVDHRDTLLTEPERADGMMLVCISRAAKGQRLTLDL